MNGGEKSDPAIVAVKPTNNSGQPAAERVEPRAGAEGNAEGPHGVRAQSRATSSSGIDRVRKAAKERRGEKFIALLHHIDVALLGQAYHWLKRDAAPGVDAMTWDAYGEGLDARLCDLEGRIHRGSYRAQPSLRAYIAKPDGRQRPLGIAALEDKIVQRAVVEVLNAIYETDFVGFSYGFRPGRGAHDALDALAVGIENRAVNWILDADIKGFFDNISHAWLMRLVEHRIGDRRVLRLIRKWLKAGVVEDGIRHPVTKGTPQGAVVSPLLANIYLHYVFDLWADQWRQRHATGAMIVVRYADDTVVGFEHRADAERFLAGLRIRMAEFDLELHPDKTRLIEFGRHAATDRAERRDGKPETPAFAGAGSSTSWVLPIFAHVRAGVAFCCPAIRDGTGNGRSSWKSPKTSEGAGTRTWPNRGDGWDRWCGASSLTMPCRPTFVLSRRSATMSSDSGAAPCSGAVRRIERHGRTWTGWRIAGCPNPGYPIPGLLSAFASNTRGGSRMREFRPYGSVRGAPSNGRPYRDWTIEAVVWKGRSHNRTRRYGPRAAASTSVSSSRFDTAASSADAPRMPPLIATLSRPNAARPRSRAMHWSGVPTTAKRSMKGAVRVPACRESPRVWAFMS